MGFQASFQQLVPVVPGLEVGHHGDGSPLHLLQHLLVCLKPRVPASYCILQIWSDIHLVEFQECLLVSVSDAS